MSAKRPDGPPACRISPHRDGPLIVRGPFRLVDADGGEVELRRRTVALCRCGRSRIAPFCDGTHKSIGFRSAAASGGEQSQPE